jgi:cytochrome b561
MAATSEAAPAPRVRSHRLLTTTLVTVATILAFFACFAVWANRQALNTNNWTKTSGNLLEDHAVQDALSVYLVNQVFQSVNVSHKLEEALPGELKGLSGPVAAGLRQLAGQAVPKLLANPQVQELFKQANRNAHRQLLAILNGGNALISTSNGVVVLNLHELVTQLAGQLGVSSQVETAREKLSGSTGEVARSTAEEKLGITLPPSTGKITILRASQLKTAQDIAKAIKGLAILLPLLGLALYALAIWFAEGRRRAMLRTVGWCFFGVGVTLLLARRVAGETVVDELVKVPANKPAGEAVWSIGTSLLYDIAIAMVLYGVAIVIAAWIAGRTRVAMALRQAAAPWMRTHEAGSYGVAGVVLLVIVLWGPTPATRQFLPVLGFVVLFAFGVWVLRRETEAEFPDAQSSESMAALRSMFHRRPHSPAVPAAAAVGPSGRTSAPPAAKGARGDGEAEDI